MTHSQASAAGLRQLSRFAFHGERDRSTPYVELLEQRRLFATLPEFTTVAGLSSGGDNPYSVASGDFNGDGNADLATTNLGGANTLAVLLGDGAGTFVKVGEYPTGAETYAYWVVVGDFNNDSIQDIAVANDGFPGFVSAFIGQGNGSFSPAGGYALGGRAAYIVNGDVNNDSYQDLVIANYTSNTVSVLFGSGTGAFSAPATYPIGGATAYSVALEDFNHDGLQDIAVALYASGGVSVLLNTGAGAFSDPQIITLGGAFTTVVAADFNSDGHPDLAGVDLGAGNIVFFQGNGDGSFAPMSAIASGDAYPLYGDVGDFNGDGALDLAYGFYGQPNDKVAIIVGDGTGGFAGPITIATGEATTYSDVAIGDFNNDGAQDLAVTRYTSGANLVILLNSTPGIANHPPLAIAGGPYAMQQGQSLALDASDSGDPDNDPLEYTWDLNGDSTFGDATGPTPTLSASELEALGIGGAAGTFSVRVRVSDGQHVVDSAPTTLTVSPRVPGTGLSLFFDKETFIQVTGAASETGAIPQLGNIGTSYTIGNITLSGPTTYALYLGALPSDGVPHNDFSSRIPGNEIGLADKEDLDVSLAAPRHALGFDFVKPINDFFGYSSAGPTTFSVVLKAANGDVVGSFHYDAPGPFVPADAAAFVGVWSPTPFVRMEIRDLVGSPDDEYFGQFYGSTAAPGQGDNTSPTLHMMAIGAPIAEGGTTTLSGTYHDADADDTHALDIDWDGDGAYDEVGVPVAGGAFSLLHRYDDDLETADVNVRLYDDQGGVSNGVASVTVSNVAPTATIAGPGSIAEGSPFVIALTDAFDPSPQDAAAGLRYFISDSQADRDAATYDSSSGLASKQFTFADDGEGVIYARVIDKDGGFTDYQKSITALNVAPTATLSGLPAYQPLPGESLSLVSGVTDPGALDTYAYFWTVRRNGVSIHVGSDSTISFIPEIAGAYEIELIVADNGGATSNVAVAWIQVISCSISGLVWEDAISNGEVNLGESGITDVFITLAGVDDLGQPVLLVQQTDGDGAFVFLNIRPGTYSLTQTQPSGWVDGMESVGTLGGISANNVLSNIAVGVNEDGFNYNFGEVLPDSGVVVAGQAAPAGFWQNRNGQSLIKSLNGGSDATALGQWLAQLMPRFFGPEGHNMASFTNSQVAALYQQLFKVKGQKLDAQVLATALSTYVTDSTLAGAAAQPYGFVVTLGGLGIATWNVGSSGAAFGVANGTNLRITDLLLATDAQVANGMLYGGSGSLRSMASAVFEEVNSAGSIA